jgi:hypothetical protein
LLDIDSKTTEVFGPGKDGAAVGHTGVRGVDFLAATLSSPISAPVITGTRLRGGNANTRRAATSFVRKYLTTARQTCGATGPLLVRMDSGYYSGDILAAIIEVTAEARHRDRAGAIEQVFADLNDSALAHFPSGRFAANAAWLTLAALTHNLLRATGCLTSRTHATARTATLRRHLIALAGRLARSARVIVIHLPRNWPWADSYAGLFTATHHHPSVTT